MVEKKNKGSIRRFLESPLFLIVCIPVAVLVAYGFIQSYYNGYKINQEISALESDIESLKHKNFELIDLYKYVMSDDFVEEKARTELNMKKEGENVLVFKNDNDYVKNESDSYIDSGQRMTNPLKWWYYFTNKKYIENQQ